MSRAAIWYFYISSNLSQGAFKYSCLRGANINSLQWSETGQFTGKREVFKVLSEETFVKGPLITSPSVSWSPYLLNDLCHKRNSDHRHFF